MIVPFLDDFEKILLFQPYLSHQSLSRPRGPCFAIQWPVERTGMWAAIGKKSKTQPKWPDLPWFSWVIK